MNWINNFVLGLTEPHLLAAKYMLALNAWVLVAYLGLVAGCVHWSLFFNVVDQNQRNTAYGKLAKYLIDFCIPNRTAAVVFGVIPVLSAVLLSAQVLYTSLQIPTVVMATALLFIPVGLALLCAYRETFHLRETKYYEHIIAGVAGLGTFMLGCFFVTSSIALMHDPEKWPFIHNPYHFLMFSWHSIARVNLFVFLSFALAGTALMYFYGRDHEHFKNDDDQVRRWIRNFGAGLAIVACLVLPVMLFWNLITLPHVALSFGLFISSFVALFILALVARSLYQTLVHQDQSPAYRSFIGVLTVTLVFTVVDYIARENATRDTTLTLVNAARAETLKREAEIKAKMPAEMVHGTEPSSAPVPAGGSSATGGDAAKGKVLAEAKGCLSCHSLDGSQLVGPTWKGLVGHEVVVLIDGKEQTVVADDTYLRRSILEPNAEVVKGYQPIMPSQKGLMTDEEINAVIAYIKTIN